MNKKLIIVITLIGAIGVVALIIFFVAEKSQAPKQSQQTQSELTNQTAGPTNKPVSDSQQQPAVSNQGKSLYTEYNPQNVAADSNTKILFFYAPWCPQCRQLDTDITNNISADNGITIYKVDYDTNQELRKKYGVTLQTTLVKIDNSGNLIKKYVAYQEPTYANVKANLY